MKRRSKQLIIERQPLLHSVSSNDEQMSQPTHLFLWGHPTSWTTFSGSSRKISPYRRVLEWASTNQYIIYKNEIPFNWLSDKSPSIEECAINLLVSILYSLRGSFVVAELPEGVASSLQQVVRVVWHLLFFRLIQILYHPDENERI